MKAPKKQRPLLDVDVVTDRRPIDPRQEIRRRAEFSSDGRMRHLLARDWPDWTKGNGKRVLFIGHNPSIADAARDDPTTQRWIQFAQAWGYSGLWAMNLIPLISPDPAACVAEFHKLSLDQRGQIASDNVYRIAKAAAACALVVACWGNASGRPGDAARITRVLGGGGHAIYCLGTNMDGSPRHPMSRGLNRIPDDQEPVRWK